MSNENNAPSHIVYIATGKNRHTGKDNLSRVGALWPHQKGTGFNLRLKATSNNGEGTDKLIDIRR